MKYCTLISVAKIRMRFLWQLET